MKVKVCAWDNGIVKLPRNPGQNGLDMIDVDIKIDTVGKTYSPIFFQKNLEFNLN